MIRPALPPLAPPLEPRPPPWARATDPANLRETRDLEAAFGAGAAPLRPGLVVPDVDVKGPRGGGLGARAAARAR